LSLNWEGADLYLNKKGFLLSDACISVLIVSLCALLVYGVMKVHWNTAELLHQKEDEMEIRMEDVFERIMPCAECKVDSPS
jgi:uncharacterized membrane protein (Fun14 family)